MFGIAVCVGFGDELYRFTVEHQSLGIFVPITIGCIFVWSLAGVLKEASKKYKTRTLFLFGTLVVVAVIAGGVVCIQSASLKSVSGQDRYREARLRIMADEQRLVEIRTAVQAQNSAGSPQK